MKPELEPICFQVEKVESVSVMKNDAMQFNSENSFAILGSWPTENGVKEKILNFCSGVYNLIENKTILEPLIPVLEAKFKDLKIVVSNNNDAQFTVRMSPFIPSFSPNTEVIRPAITFTNSYDGKVLAQATGGLVRHVVDAKGKVFTTFSSFLKELSFAYTFKHNNEAIYSMVGISEKIDAYIQDFSSVESQIAFLKKVTISNPTSAKLSKLIRKFAAGTLFPIKDIEDTIDRINYESEIFATDEPSLWNIYNSMNYIVEDTEKVLTAKMRIDTDAKIYANIVEFISKKKK